MPRATLCVDVDTVEQAAVDAWLLRWRGRLAFVSDNEGCGCCVDMYDVDAPREALAELPASVFCSSAWAGFGDSVGSGEPPSLA